MKNLLRINAVLMVLIVIKLYVPEIEARPITAIPSDYCGEVSTNESTDWKGLRDDPAFQIAVKVIVEQYCRSENLGISRTDVACHGVKERDYSPYNHNINREKE